ncbi:MAG: hypothetical protein C5B58_00160 [Acidobacteria bacterium]|nr:MAG: hypothetical protein C5B58_00160 [Acidobacteriota bacterium]
MKRLVLLGLALALCFAGWMGVRDYHWAPADAPRWNPFAIKESGVGRTLARILTEEANTSYHHGLFEQRPPTVANPFSQWLDAGTNSLGFQGRLKYRPVEQYPLRPYEVKEALEQAEKNLRLAFELDPGNYTAYDVYFFFLTTQVTQTEFASMNGAQFKDEDDDDDQANKALNAPASAGPNAERQKFTPTFEQWVGQERERRQKRAIEITDEAIRKFRSNTQDPERFLSAAVMWYNRFLLLAPEVAQRRTSAEARKKFEEAGRPALDEMKYYLDKAEACEHDLETKGLWQALPERRKEYYQVKQLLKASALSLSIALQNNRAQMNHDRLGVN